MKNIIILAIVAASILLIGCSKMGTAIVERTKKEVATSQVIGYASTATSTTTNISLTVTEIWKSSEETTRFGITNGMQFSQDNPAGRLPEGAIFLFSFDTNRQTSSEEMIWVRSGRVERMTVQEFKAKIGL
jgi:outer membrane murein-binding lipoprotein Lpp